MFRRSIVGTVLLNGTLGLIMCIVFAFCTTDLEGAMQSPTGYDFIYVFFAGNESLVGTSIMTSILIVLVTCASFGFLASSSRQTWAFARDRGLPYSDWLVHVHFLPLRSRISDQSADIWQQVSKERALPLRAIGFCTVITALICVINVGSSVAFNAIVSITIAGLFTSYLIPITLVAARRALGHDIRWGPWKMGRLGLPINLLSITFLSISIVFSFFSPGLPVTPESMNWSCLVFPVVLAIGLIYYAVIGRHVWQGPIYEWAPRAVEVDASRGKE